MALEPVEIKFSGGINNLYTPLALHLRKQGEVQKAINTDLYYPGQIRRVLPLVSKNNTVGGSLRSVFAWNSHVFVMDGSALKYMGPLYSDLTTLVAAFSANEVSFEVVGDWVFIGAKDNRKSVYLGSGVPTVCDWGQDLPTTAPTVTAGAAGNPNGTYSCYYRYRITLPDDTIILTAISPVGSVVTTSDKIEWSNLVHSTFTGAKTRQIDLLRTMSSWSETYLVTTLNEGTTTYSDDKTDAEVQAGTVYDEAGYYPPPDYPSIVKYFEPADRVFAVINGDAYWSEAGKYHTFLYSATAGEYTNVNSVFLGDEHITAVKRLDENLYFGSRQTWRRLRGRAPSQWLWDNTSALTGPLSDKSAADTPFGVIYPAIDGRLWRFNGFTAAPLMEEFVFTVKPDATSHGTFDGRFYRLFYGDPTYPEIIVDFMRFSAETPARLVQSTRSATSSCWDRMYSQLYLTDRQYVRMGDNPNQSVAVTMRTAAVPTEKLVTMGTTQKMLIRVNTKGDSLYIYPVLDGIIKPALTAVVTDSLLYKEIPISFGDARTIAFEFSITSAQDIILEEPFLILPE